ncbi:MAG TPA: spore germination protein [Ruminiclostridium sp.]|nr:spore germination protein [Ruminiclostridium sp.]
MFGKKRRKENSSKLPKAEENETISSYLGSSLEENITTVKKLFKNDDTLIVRRFESPRNTGFCVIFTEGMIDSTIVNDNIIKPIMNCPDISSGRDIMDSIMYQVIVSNSVEKVSDIDSIIEAIVSGDTVLFAEGSSNSLVINSKGWSTRAITEPEGEKLIRGPREGFTESLTMNITLIRRRLATNSLKFKIRSFGKQSRTKICICYIEGIANNQILNELNRRLEAIDIDGITGSGTIAELIRDSPFTPFKTIGSTERPDVVAGKLLEGRIAVIVNGTPVAMTLPYIFIESFQSNEDYYINYYFSSINRVLRILSFIITVSAPAIYVALACFHQEMIPTPLIKSLSAARQDVPFPTVVEVLVLLITFELLREAGTRMPTNIGQALSIVGALVIGQASVEARFVSAPVVIIVALTAITGLTLPRIKGVEITLRFLFLILSSIIGLYGYIFGVIGMLIQLFSMRSFGVPYMLSLMNVTSQNLKDTVIRAPWIYMKYRPKFIAATNRTRVTAGGKKH